MKMRIFIRSVSSILILAGVGLSIWYIQKYMTVSLWESKNAITSLAVALLLIVALVLMLYGSRRKSAYAENLSTGLIVLCLFVILAELRDWRETLVAWSTLMLAGAAVWTIRDSNKREAMRRDEDLSRERRDRNEKLVSEILSWVLEVVDCNSEMNLKNGKYYKGQASSNANFGVDFREFQSTFHKLRQQGEYILGISQEFKSEGDMPENIERMRDYLTEQIQGLESVREMEVHPGLNTTASDVLETITKLKLSFLHPVHTAND